MYPPIHSLDYHGVTPGNLGSFPQLHQHTKAHTPHISAYTSVTVFPEPPSSHLSSQRCLLTHSCQLPTSNFIVSSCQPPWTFDMQIIIKVSGTTQHLGLSLSALSTHQHHNSPITIQHICRFSSFAIFAVHRHKGTVAIEKF